MLCHIIARRFKGLLPGCSRARARDQSTSPFHSFARAPPLATLSLWHPYYKFHMHIHQTHISVHKNSQHCDNGINTGKFFVDDRHSNVAERQGLAERDRMWTSRKKKREKYFKNRSREYLTWNAIRIMCAWRRPAAAKTKKKTIENILCREGSTKNTFFRKLKKKNHNHSKLNRW